MWGKSIVFLKTDLKTQAHWQKTIPEIIGIYVDLILIYCK